MRPSRLRKVQVAATRRVRAAIDASTFAGGLLVRHAPLPSTMLLGQGLLTGLDTPLGKEFHDGVDLSVGQWQKLAIARAYVRPAALLVLDEPAAALDARAEAAVYARFAELAAGRTVLLISHRLGSCRLAGRILVLHDGALVEDGAHEQLLAAGGRYAELYRMQAEWYR